MIETVSFQRRENWDELTKQEKLALQDIYPASKYTKIPDIDMEDWKRIKYDYKDKFTHYKSLVPQVSGSALFVLSGGDGPKLKKYEPVIDDPIITKNFSRILPFFKTNIGEHAYEEEVISDLYEQAKKYNKNIKVFEIMSLGHLVKILIGEYLVDETSSLIDTFQLNEDLKIGNVYFDFYRDENTPADETRDFFYMNKLLLSHQTSMGDPTVPYNKCLAIFMVLYYMRCNTACSAFMKSIHVIMGTFNGMLQVEEMLSLLLLPYSKPTEKTVSQLELEKDFPTLLDMKLSFYKFIVLDQGKYFCDIKSKSFFMNKISYYTFVEHFDDMEGNRFRNYKNSMVYTFRLLIPDEENFKIAKSIGFIDSRRIDWSFWQENVIKHAFPSVLSTRELDFLVERQYLLLRKMKRKYYNFFNNLATDYYRKSVYEPVSLVFNIAAIIFALTGVIQVLQAAGVIPSLS